MKTLETKSVVLLHHHLKSLRLPTIGAECEKVAKQAAADNVDHLSYLLQLLESRIVGPGETFCRATLEGSKVPDHKDPRELRLRGSPVGQQGADRRAGSL